MYTNAMRCHSQRPATRTLFISQAGALRASRAAVEGSSNIDNAECISGYQREDDRTVSRGWFVKVYRTDGSAAYL